MIPGNIPKSDKQEVERAVKMQGHFVFLVFPLWVGLVMSLLLAGYASSYVEMPDL